MMLSMSKSSSRIFYYHFWEGVSRYLPYCHLNVVTTLWPGIWGQIFHFGNSASIHKIRGKWDALK